MFKRIREFFSNALEPEPERPTRVRTPPLEASQRVEPELPVHLIVPIVKCIAEQGSPDKTVTLPLEHSPVIHPFASDIGVLYAFDRPDRFEYMSNRQVKSLGYSAEQLYEQAVRNLPSRLPEIKLHDCGSGLFGFTAGGDFEASLLLIDDLWEQMADRLPGNALAAVPSRDLLFFIGSEQPNAYEIIVDKARTKLEDTRYAVSQSVLVRREKKWYAMAN